MATNRRQVGGEYYARMRVQPWDALEEWLTPDQMRGYLLGSAIAYLARFNVDDPGKGGIVDICKAQHYLDHLFDVLAERLDDDDDMREATAMRGYQTDPLEPAPEPAAPPPAEPAGDGAAAPSEPIGRDLKAMVDGYAREGMTSTAIAVHLNDLGLFRPDGREWTPYQVAMLIATPRPTAADPTELAASFEKLAQDLTRCADGGGI